MSENIENFLFHPRPLTYVVVFMVVSLVWFFTRSKKISDTRRYLNYHDLDKDDRDTLR